MSGSAERSTHADERSGSEGMWSEADRQAAWDVYFAAHPEIIASYSRSNGGWPPVSHDA